MHLQLVVGGYLSIMTLEEVDASVRKSNLSVTSASATLRNSISFFQAAAVFRSVCVGMIEGDNACN